jgi:hypothetical protein
MHDLKPQRTVVAGVSPAMGLDFARDTRAATAIEEAVSPAARSRLEQLKNKKPDGENFSHRQA